MKKSSSKQTKTKKDQILWQEIPENAQDKISGGILLFANPFA